MRPSLDPNIHRHIKPFLRLEHGSLLRTCRVFFRRLRLVNRQVQRHRLVLDGRGSLAPHLVFASFLAGAGPAVVTRRVKTDQQVRLCYEVVGHSLLRQPLVVAACQLGVLV